MPRLFSTLLLLIVAGTAAAADSVQWENAYGAAGRHYNPSAIAGAPDGSLYVAGTSAAPGFGGKAPEFWLWKIDPEGRLAHEAPIARGDSAERINPSADHIKDIALHASGGALIVEFDAGVPYFVTFDRDGKITAAKQVQMAERKLVTITRFFPVAEGEYLVLGSADGRGFAVRLNREGMPVWSARSAVADQFWDGAVQRDGSFVAVGSAEARPNEFTLSFFAPGRNEPRVVTVKGRRASIAAGSGGNYGIVFDRSDDETPQLSVATVAGGEIVQEVSVSTDAPAAAPPYRIAQVGPNRFLVAGTNHDGIVVMDYEQGKVTPRLATNSEHRPWHWSLQRVIGQPAAALTIVYVDTEELTTRVGIIRFR